MKASLVGRTALVTGGSRGIGLAIAQRLSRAGARVLITGRKADALEAALSQLPEGVEAVQAHAGDPQAARSAVEQCLDRLGSLDILVNNAGTNPYAGPVIDIPLTAWDKTFEVNLRGPLVWTQEAWSGWMREHGGAVLNISSNSAFLAGGPIGAYQVSKAALQSLTRHLATELGPRTRVNAIAPGLVQTDFARMLWEPVGSDADFPWPMRRIGRPEDIAGAALWLVSDEASWVTGTTLVVDGGALTHAASGL